MEREGRELPQQVVDRLGPPPVNGQLLEAGREVFNLWVRYFRGSQTRVDSQQRTEEMGKYLELLDDVVREQLESCLPFIRDEALRTSQEERERQQQRPTKKHSRGEALHDRRKLAQKRRGTPPYLIH